MKQWNGRILTGLGLLVIIAGSILGYLADKRMGVQRSLIYRNAKLMEGILSPMGLALILVAVLGTSLWLVLFLRKRNRFALSSMKTLGVFGSVLVLMALTGALSFTNFMGTPWMLLGAIPLYLGQWLSTLNGAMTS